MTPPWRGVPSGVPDCLASRAAIDRFCAGRLEAWLRDKAIADAVAAEYMATRETRR